MIKTVGFYKVSVLFLGYAISCMQWPLVLLIIAAISLIWLENYNHSTINKVKVKAKACSFNEHDLLQRIEEIPPWVKFPDRERAEWLNKIIVKFHPIFTTFAVTFFREYIETKIQEKYDSFEFGNINFGNRSPKIDGIKVYDDTTTDNSVIIDFDLLYDSDCDIRFSISGKEVGGVQDFQLGASVRIVLKPLISKLPLIGGIQIYFLNRPDIDYTLDGLWNIPGFSYFLKTKIVEAITKKMVFPNKITKRFSKSIAVSELAILEPRGVLRIHVFEAKDLMTTDIRGRSDPYVILTLGAQERKTNIINNTLNPKWDYWCEFIVVDPNAQYLTFKVFDKNMIEDDFIGSGRVDIGTVLKGYRDQWIKLDDAKHGSIHIRFTWLALSSCIKDLDAIREETKILKVNNISRAILIVYVSTTTNLPEAKHSVKPNPFFYLTVGEHKEKSKSKKHTVNPAWEQGFVFLVQKPLQEYLQMTVMDKSTESLLTQFSYKISDLTNEKDMTIYHKEFSMANEGSKVVLSMELKILINELYEKQDDKSDTDSDDYSVGHNILRQQRFLKSEVEDVTSEFLDLTTSDNSSGRHGLGRLELTVDYHEPRQKLIVTIHQVSNLPLEHFNDVPDPYVRVKTLAENQITGSSQRTRVIVDSCNPVFEETFEYLFSLADVNKQTLSVAVKSKKFLHNNTMGHVELPLHCIDLSESYRVWFDLGPKP